MRGLLRNAAQVCPRVRDKRNITPAKSQHAALRKNDGSGVRGCIEGFVASPYRSPRRVESHPPREVPMIAFRALSAAIVTAAITAGCATTAAESPYAEPYAFVEPGVASTTRKEAPAFIHTVDGQQPVSSRYSIPLQTGTQVAQVDFII